MDEVLGGARSMTRRRVPARQKVGVLQSKGYGAQDGDITKSKGQLIDEARGEAAR